MLAILVAIVTLLAGGLAALLVGSRHPLAHRVGSVSALAGCAAGLAGVARIRLQGATPSLRIPWSIPYGEIHLEVDPLASFFLMLVFGLCFVAAIFGSGYLRSYAGHKWLGPPWFFFNLLAASMALVVTAADGLLFLVAWEVMALASFFLVTFEDEREASRRAGWIYLVATHAGTVFLIVLFLLMARETGSLDFARWSAMAGAPPAIAGVLFLFAIVGFGTKAGIVPFHVWLPEAHPAAPAHVSAVMSGVMIKTGIYGLLRVMTFLGPPPPWWAMVLLGIGITSGLLGVLFAVAQPDLKRILAYSSVENIGIVFLGLALAALGSTYGEPSLVALGLAGAFLHMMNHAIFKGLLFMGAGEVIHRAGTGRIDRLGGVMRAMPAASAAILTGAAAISGLPPLNGFTGEMFLYVGALQGAGRLGGARALLPLAALVGLALIGGLAAACFLRLFGTVFLGHPRSGSPAHAGGGGRAANGALLLLAALCLALGLAPGYALRIVEPAVASVMLPLAGGASVEPSREAAGLVSGVTLTALLLVGISAALLALRRALPRGGEVRRALTWDCGYASPTPRMQHTGSSLARPMAEVFPFVLPGRRQEVSPAGYFPAAASLAVVMTRPFQERFYRPAFERIAGGMSRLRWLQHGAVQLYVLYIVVTLIALLVWFAAL